MSSPALFKGGYISTFPAIIMLKFITDRYRPARNPVGQIAVRYRLKQNASWKLMPGIPKRQKNRAQHFLQDRMYAKQWFRSVYANV